MKKIFFFSCRKDQRFITLNGSTRFSRDGSVYPSKQQNYWVSRVVRHFNTHIADIPRHGLGSFVLIYFRSAEGRFFFWSSIPSRLKSDIAHLLVLIFHRLIIIPSLVSFIYPFLLFIQCDEFDLIRYYPELFMKYTLRAKKG